MESQIALKIVITVVLFYAIFFICKKEITIKLANLLPRWIQFEKKITPLSVSKIVIAFGLVYVIFLIWGIQLLNLLPQWMKPEKEFTLPQPFYQLRHTGGKYQKGISIYGVKWESDFLLYEFTFWNKSKKTEMQDVRLKFDLPGTFVSYDISKQEGIESISISDENDYLMKHDSGIIVDTVDYRTNRFTINIGKAHPDGFIKFNLIFQKAKNDIKNANYFTIRYSFIDQQGEKQIESKMYRIVVGANKDDWNIDETKEVLGKHLRKFSFVPEKPITSK